MFGLVDAIDALLELDPPGLRSAPRVTSTEIKALRDAKKRPKLPPPPPRPLPRRGRAYEVPMSAVEGIARGPARRSLAPFALAGAALAVGVAFLGRSYLREDAPRRSLAAAATDPPRAASIPVSSLRAPAAAPPRELAPRSLPLAPEAPLPPSPRESFTAPAVTPAPPPASASAHDVPALIEALADPRCEPAVRARAAATLAATSDPVCERALDDVALSGDPAGRMLALEALGQRGQLSIQARIAVDRALSDPDPGLRAAAVRAMVAVRGATSTLIPRLPRERDPVVVCAMFETIGATAGPEHIPTLMLYARQLPSAARAVTAACLRNGIPVPAR